MPAFDLGVNLADPDTFASGFPHEVFRDLRREAPVYWHARGHERGGKGFFVVSKYEDVKYVGRTPQIYSSEPGITVVENQADFEAGQSSMLQMDPPRHARYRKLVSAGFTPRRINALEPMIRALANEILDDAVKKPCIDFVTDIAAELPLRVIARFLGVPLEDRALLFSASNRLLGFEDAEYGTNENDGRLAAMELATLAYRIGEARKAAPQDDIVTILLNAEVDGLRLSDIDFIAFFVLLTIAGNETTRNQTSHTLRLLLEHPDELAKLRADPSLLNCGRRGGSPFQPARDVLPPHDEGRYGAARRAHPERVVRRCLLSIRQSRRRSVPGTRSLRRHTEPERAPRVRRRRALLSRGEPRAPPASVHDRGDAAALPGNHARRRD